MIELKQVLKALEDNQDSLLFFVLPSGEELPSHFHVTEVGKVHKSFVDCGGTWRETYFVSLQLWVANDFQHRLKAAKVLKIIKNSNEVLKAYELPVRIEYGTEVVGSYELSKIEIVPNGIAFIMEAKKTECLAPDKCGVKQCS